MLVYKGKWRKQPCASKNYKMPNGFLASIQKLLWGQLLSQGVSIVGMLLVAWLYGAAIFGEYSFVWLIATTIGSFASLRYERALLVPGSSECKLVLIVYCLSLIAFVFTMIGFYISMRGILVSITASLFVLLFSLVQLYVQVRIRDEDYSLIAKGDVVYALVLVLLQVVFFYIIGSTAISLMIASVLTKSLQFKIIFKKIQISSLNLGGLLREASDHYRFPAYSVPNSLLTIAPMRTAMVVTGLSVSPELFGFFTIAQRIVMFPVTAIANAIRRVFVSVYSKAKTTGGDDVVTVLSALVIRVGLLTSMLLFAGIVASSADVRLFDGYVHIIRYANVFLPIASVYLLFSWMDRIYEVESQQHISLFLEAFGGAVIVAIFLICYKYIDINVALFSFTWTTVLYNYIWLYVTMTKSLLSLDFVTKGVALTVMLVGAMSIFAFYVQLLQII